MNDRSTHNPTSPLPGDDRAPGVPRPAKLPLPRYGEMEKRYYGPAQRDTR